MNVLNILCLVVLMTVFEFSQFSSAGIICKNKRSDPSGNSIGDEARVQCRKRQQMTGCSSHVIDGHGGRNGEYIELDGDGYPVCVAVNGKDGNTVKAFARCCTSEGMTCEYVQGEKSKDGDNKKSWAECPAGASVTGCMVKTDGAHLDGAAPDSDKRNMKILSDMYSNRCRGQNGLDGTGVWAQSACCTAPDIECKVLWSTRSRATLGAQTKIKCDDGWMMTGCSTFGWYEHTDGSYIKSDKCFAHTEGNGERGVYAVAVCCQVGL